MSKASKALKRRGVGTQQEVFSHHKVNLYTSSGLRSYQQDAVDLLSRLDNKIIPIVDGYSTYSTPLKHNTGKTNVPGAGSKYLPGGVRPSKNHEGEE